MRRSLRRLEMRRSGGAWAGVLLLAAGVIGACGPRHPAEPYPLPVPHERALPAPATERDGGAQRLASELESLGERASHGSIRMANEDIIELAKQLMEAGGEPRPDSWYDEVLASETDMVSVTLPDPITLVNRE